MFIMQLSSQASMPEFPLTQMIVILGCIGGSYGVLCSVLSLRLRKEAQG
jgi:hypothetical protein